MANKDFEIEVINTFEKYLRGSASISDRVDDLTVFCAENNIDSELFLFIKNNREKLVEVIGMLKDYANDKQKNVYVSHSKKPILTYEEQKELINKFRKLDCLKNCVVHISKNIVEYKGKPYICLEVKIQRKCEETKAIIISFEDGNIFPTLKLGCTYSTYELYCDEIYTLQDRMEQLYDYK